MLAPYRLAAVNSQFLRAARELSGIGMDFVGDLLSGEALYPRKIFLNGVGIAAAWADGMGGILPESLNRSVWLETANRFRVYRLFASADSCFRPCGGSGLQAVADRVSQFDSYSQVWTMEGIGYHHAQRRKPLSTADVDQLPHHTLVPLHTGAGLAVAQHVLATAEARSDMPGMVREFQVQCGRIARSGYEEPMLEALGLVAVTLHPHILNQLDREVANLGGHVVDLFWHGVGRGLYFMPRSVLPLAQSRERAVESALCLPGNESGRGNALAGLVWAMTLVNIRDPDVIASWLWHLTDIDQAVMNGLTSSLVVWLASLPDDEYVDRLCRFEPSDRDSAEMWSCTIGRACRDARRLHATTHEGNLAATVFRVRPLQSPKDAPA